MNRVRAELRNCSIPGTDKECFTSLKSPNMPTHWVRAAHSTGVKQPWHKAIHSSPSTCKFRNVQSWIFPLCHTPSLVWCLIKNKLYLSPMRLERKGYINGFWKLMLQNEDANKIAGTSTVKLQQLVSYSCIND